MCNLNSPFVRDIKPTKIMSFFLQQCWKSSSRIHIGETLTHQITFHNDCRLFVGALLWIKFRRDKWMDYLQSDVKTWIRGTKNFDSGGRSLCLPIPDLCLAQLDTFSNAEWRWTARDKFKFWNTISRSAVAVNCVRFTVWHLHWKLGKVGKFQQPANGVWPIYFTRQITRIFGKWQVPILNLKDELI